MIGLLKRHCQFTNHFEGKFGRAHFRQFVEPVGGPVPGSLCCFADSTGLGYRYGDPGSLLELNLFLFHLSLICIYPWCWLNFTNEPFSSVEKFRHLPQQILVSLILLSHVSHRA